MELLVRTETVLVHFLHGVSHLFQKQIVSTPSLGRRELVIAQSGGSWEEEPKLMVLSLETSFPRTEY